jgi:hypothetical protein
MAVDKQILEKCIKRAAGSDTEFADYLRDKYSKNDQLAVDFVGGFMANDDYTQKTQGLAEQRKQYESQSSQLESTRKALEAAEVEKNQILKDLAQHRVSTAKARELMQILSDKYQLTDEDLPGMSDLIATAKKGKPVDNTPDIETRLAAFGDEMEKRIEKKFVGAMMPELSSMAALPLIWAEISREHQELTGKALTFAEQQEILKGAREGNRGLRDVWEEKYQIAGDTGLRMQKRDEKLKQSWQSEQEKAAAEARQKAALEVVTPVATDLGTGPGISRAFQTKFREYSPDPNAQPGQQFKPADGKPAVEVQPGQHVRQIGDRGPTGAQRAAAKHLEKLATGGYGKKAS